ncbi:hypothetical protein TVAG_365690 [Trichomonas vaginalis G3]|uniref:Uncharacterized protein n=1 Tax=Trichomonas vaginalis (strain ATCC PRA-98 / G3) TaxID=412133 RepID=A2DHL3_TRIV3|nr:hypothetical protein TVAGG3_0302630 [Trichomonas vaginalis G3]EAY20061.1 hypothetical protein TVAG_365690 [Trichomonas vaginalis G3]KAI5528013.1 hypothetical protein TVAGG3_0302630 [Trichomonas vaginalis G3]|eukprot:XP_001581047.1 hypothetical protein [Trichomonas vaginalis G3]
MLSFEACFPPKRARQEKGIRSRIIGELEGKKLLYSVNSSKQTSIELVKPDGDSITALSFNEYIDVVNADLSPDNEMIHITRRVTSNKGFGFISKVYHIHSQAKSRDFYSDKPIYAFFLPDSKNTNYSLIHIVGNKISHIRAILTKNSIDIEVYRGGINIPNVVSWTYHRSISLLIVLHEIKQQSIVLSEFNLHQVQNGSTVPIPIQVNPKSQLPHEVSLNPLSALHIPFFRCKTNRIFSTRHSSKICVIQQLFTSVDEPLSFSVCMYPHNFNTIITVPNTPSDLPIVYMQFGSLIFCFVVNCFICFIDISQNPPFISLQMNPYSAGPVSDCASHLPLRHHLVDISTGDVFQVKLTLAGYSTFVRSIDSSKIDLFAIICAKLQDPVSMAPVFALLELCGDPFIVIHFAQKLFRYLSFENRYSKVVPPKRQSLTHGRRQQFLIRQQSMPEAREVKLPESITHKLASMEAEFPAASFVPRKRTFWTHIKKVMTEDRSRTLDDACKKAIVKMESQNSASLIIRSSLDKWISEYKPDPFWQFLISFAFVNETVMHDFPTIPVLREESESLLNNIGSEEMRRTFRAHKVFRMAVASHERYNELRYWKNRVPRGDSEGTDTSLSTIVFAARHQSTDLLSAEVNPVTMSGEFSDLVQ